MIECSNIEEARACIDRIDDQIVRLLAERSEYVGEAMKFKKVAQDANVPSRNAEIFQRVRALSVQYDLDPDLAEGVYRRMIEEFVRFQTRELGKKCVADAVPIGVEHIEAKRSVDLNGDRPIT